MKKLLFISSVLLSISNIFAAKELIIKPAFQEYTHWCWAACCEMVLDAYGETEDQYDCARLYKIGIWQHTSSYWIIKIVRIIKYYIAPCQLVA